jgi:sugar lactone lactonase YvrE
MEWTMTACLRPARFVRICVVVLTLISGYAFAESDHVDFESGRWMLGNAEVTEYLGRKCLAGRASLRDVEFQDGVIEVDVAVTGGRSYPGVDFRIQSEADHERVYIRPHRAGLYPDAIQYTPVANGIASWQLFNGSGYTAAVELPDDEWVPIRVEVMGKRARVFVGEAGRPALVVNDLQHGLSSGTIGLNGPTDGTAYFSDFRYSTEEAPDFGSEPLSETPPGIISDWEISQAFRLSGIELDEDPYHQDLPPLEWQAVTSAPSGLVNVGNYISRTGREPDCILARTMIRSDRPRTMDLLFGYSDVVSIFLNGEILFTGNSAYRSRDPSFLGIIGFHDAVYLPLREGENELLLIVAEAFGGWGFMCQDADAIFEHEDISEAWTTPKILRVPESVVFDAARDVFYVSNYDAYNPSGNRGLQSIARVAVDGTLESPDWISGLNNPTGLAVGGDRLYVVERTAVAEIDLGSEEVVSHHMLPGAVLPNDIALDGEGRLYVSDSRKSVIYRRADGDFEEWLVGGEIGQPNGLYVHGTKLLVGNNADNCLKAVDLDTGEVTIIARLAPGLIDGIGTDGRGNYLVSHWEGRIYRITQSGRIVKLLDTTVPGLNCADFACAAEHRLLVIPTFARNHLVAYRLGR